jgi:hypothetical protein
MLQKMTVRPVLNEYVSGNRRRAHWPGFRDSAQRQWVPQANGTASLVFIRLAASGQTMPALELLLPVEQAASLGKAPQLVMRTIR